MIKTTTSPVALTLLLGLGLALSACGGDGGQGPFGGPVGTAQQPTASPAEVQDEAPQTETGVAQ